MSRTSYMPGKQSEQLEWAQNFVAVVAEKAGTYGIPAATMTGFTAIVDALEVAYAAAKNEQTRTKAAITLLRVQLKAMRAAAKNIVLLIQGTPSVTDEMKVLAKVTIRKTTPSRRPGPVQAPQAKNVRTVGRSVFFDARGEGDKRAFPTGAVGLTVFTHSGPTAPMSIEDWTFAFSTTKTTNIEIDLGASLTASTVWITCFYSGSRQESGPAAVPFSVQLPAAGAVPKAERKLKAA